jgi:hypothetical protein
MGTRFINAITCYEPGPQELYRGILKTKHPVKKIGLFSV